jgi:hypothetical protein
MGTLTSWNPLGHSRHVTGLLYIYLYLGLHVCCPVFLTDSKQVRILSKYFPRTHHFKFHRKPPLGAALIHTDRRADMTKLIGTSRDYANVPIEDCKVNADYKLHTFTLIQLIHSPNGFLFLSSCCLLVLSPC